MSADTIVSQTVEHGPTRSHARLLSNVAIFAPSLLLAILATYRAATLPITQDEYATAMFARLSIPELLSAASHVDAVIAPYYALIHFLAPHAGDPTAWMRWPSVLAAAGAAGVLGVIARRWWGTAAGSTAAFMLAVNPLVIYMAAMARPYALALLFVAIAVLAVDVAVTTGKLRFWLCYGASASLAALMHPFCLPALIATGILTFRRQRRPLVSWLVATAVALAAAAPVLAVAFGQRGQVAWIDRPTPKDALTTLTMVFAAQPDGTNSAVDIVIIAAVVVIVGAVATVVWVDAWKRKDRDGVRWIGTAAALLLLPWISLYGVSLVASPMLNFKYLTWSSLGWALLVGLAARTALTARAARRTAAVAGVASAALYGLFLTVGTLGNGGVGVDFTSTATDVRERVREGDLLVVAQGYESGGVAYGFAVTAGDIPFQQDVLARLVDGSQPTLELREVTGVNPLQTSARSEVATGGTVWLYPEQGLSTDIDTLLKQASIVCEAEDRAGADSSAGAMVELDCRAGS